MSDSLCLKLISKSLKKDLVYEQMNIQNLEMLSVTLKKTMSRIDLISEVHFSKSGILENYLREDVLLSELISNW